MKKILKYILPDKVIWKLNSYVETISLTKLSILRTMPILIRLNLFFNKKYFKEHQAFIEGAYKYRKSLINNKVNIYYIRRNIHRIEKGLLMQPRRDVFALRFIKETIEAVENLLNSSLDYSESEIKWALDVLTSYFNMVDSKDDNYIYAKKIYFRIKKKETHSMKIPYNYNNICSDLDFSNFQSLMKNRKSVRWYKDKKVDRELINKALDVALLAPSSCNRLPYRYIVCEKDKDMVREISSISAGTSGWNHNIPVIAVLIGKNSAFPNVENRHSIYVDSTLSVMPFILALECLGLSTCLINWADLPERELRMNKTLSLEKDEKVIMSIAIGYADNPSKVAYSARKKRSEISEFI